MGAPRLEIDLEKIYQNAHELVARLAKRDISVTGVTKATLGSKELANTLLRAGVSGLGDSRVENIKRMRLSGEHPLAKDASMTLIRSPMLSQVKEVVMYTDISCNTEIEVIKALSIEAGKQGRVHQILLMVELGDLREGILPEDLIATVGEVLALPNIVLKGIGTNLACRSGVSPDATNMAALCALAECVEAAFNLQLDTLSGGNSANLRWALSGEETATGRINNLRLGEAILLGCEPLQRLAIDGLHIDAIRLVAEVIEAKVKPTQPTGEIAQNAFGEVATVIDRGTVRQAILAIGRQDVDTCGLQAPVGVNVLAASSDHLIVESTDHDLFVGEEVTFQVNYSALLSAMTSPFVTKNYLHGQAAPLETAPMAGQMHKQALYFSNGNGIQQ